MKIEVIKLKKMDVLLCFAMGATAVLLYYILGAMWNFEWSVPMGASSDGFGFITFVKYMIAENDWSYVKGRGAPYGISIFDNLLLDTSVHWAILWPLGKLTKNVGYTVNIYYILTYGLSAICTFYMLRKLNISRMCSCSGAVIYAFFPGHILRNTGHIYIGSCFVLPLAVLGVVYFLNGNFCREEYQHYEKLEFIPLIRSGSGKLYFGVLSTMLVIFSSLYHGYFLMLIYTFVMLYVLINTKKARNVYYYCVIALTALISVFIVYMPPYLSGSNLYSNRVSVRGYNHIEYYGFKPVQLIFPIDGHRLSKFADFKNMYNGSTPIINENGMSSLGFFMSVGFIIGIVLVIFYCRKQNEELTVYGRVNLYLLLLGIIGGLSSIIGLITSVIRCYNRLSFWIGAFSLLIILRLLDQYKESFCGDGKSQFRKIICLICVSLITIAAVLDQTPDIAVKRDEQKEGKADWQQDDSFIRKIEAYEGKNAQILELPLVGMLNNVPIEDYYSLVLPYIHSEDSCWSYGAEGNFGSWLNSLSYSSVDTIVKCASVIDYTGIAVYAEAFEEEQWAGLRDSLTNLLGEADIVHEGDKWYYYNLTDYKEKIRGAFTDDEWHKLQNDIINVDASYLNILSYDGNSLFVTDGYTEEYTHALHVDPDGLEYGPYVDLEKGKYQITYLGEGLQEAEFYCQASLGTSGIDCDEILHTDNRVIYSFELSDACELVEFKCNNRSEKELIINEITCKKISDNAEMDSFIERLHNIDRVN